MNLELSHTAHRTLLGETLAIYPEPWYAGTMDIVQALEQKLTSRQRGDNVSRIYSRKQVEQAILETFELVGGITRFAHWANDPENYGEFVKVWAKIAPKEAAQEGGAVIEYRSNVPPSPLNQFEQRAIQADVEDADFSEGE
jgi:hypothetical protein